MGKYRSGRETFDWGQGIGRKTPPRKIALELDRTPQGWQLLPPAARAYVPSDVAVRVLAGNSHSRAERSHFRRPGN